MKTENQRQAILEIAEQLLKEKGYNGWSYQDIASAIGIKKASIHYYFPHKEDLGCALIEWYQQKGVAHLTEMCRGLVAPKEKLQALVALYGRVLETPYCYCLCGMLAADLLTLPEKMQTSLKKTFKEQQKWVERVLADGKEGEKEIFSFEQQAAMIVSCLQGVLLLARLEERAQEVFFETSSRFLAMIKW